MPEEQNKKSSMLFSITLLIAAIIAGGIVTSFSPLESLRPSKSQKEVERQVDEEKVLARLWQDPFQAVESAIKDANAKRQEFAIPSIGSAVRDFQEDEFVPPLTIEILCNEISKKLFRVTVQEPINTIARLNELLMIPNLYDTLLVKRPGVGFPKSINDLVDKTKGYRNKDFHNLSTDEQRYIKRLNRLLLEEIYPNESPKGLNPKIFTSQDKIQKVLILPVMVTAGPYADQAEERLRTRYALLSALHIAGYKPRNATHIGVFKAHIGQEVRCVPYECYIRDILHIYKTPLKNPYDAVLVLWLGDEYFSKNRLEEMVSIKKDVVELVAESLTTPPTTPPTTPLTTPPTTPPTALPTTAVKFLGPQYSSGLADIYEQVCNRTGGTIKEETEFAIYSPWANVDRDLIANYSNIQGTASAWSIDNFSKANISFTPTLHDYSQLTDVLVEELTRRGVNLSNNSDEHIVIISEWDAFYGRAVQSSFARSVQKHREKTRSSNTHESDNKPWSERVHSIAYMSGIDGKLPNMELDTSAVNNAGSNQKNNSPTDFDKLIHKFEQPQGRDQYDYMQRFPEKVKNTVRNPNKIRAIGVMGVDVYDKLLILRALHNEFPNALFFTTDLDARLWHHTELTFTRNLIVASSYGLQLDDMWQQDIPPFRSTYQTSVFVATLQALDVCKKDLSKIQPRIFEIGRRGAYDLSLDKEMDFHPDRPHQWNNREGLFARISYLLGLFILPCLFISGIFHCVFWNQKTYSKRYWIIYVFIGIVIFTAFVVITKRDHTWREFFNREIGSLIYLFLPPVLIISCFIWPFLPEQKDTENSLCFCFWKCFWKWFWIAWVVCFALFAAFAMASSLSGDGEPIKFFDSISLWPTELIRLFNGFLATYFFFLSCQHVKRNNKEITNMVSKQNRKDFYTDLNQTWNTFIKNNEPLNWKRCLIIGGITVVHLGIGFYFIYTNGKPLIPGRGSLCFVLDTTILIFSLLLMYFLFWHVVFSTSKCRVLIKDLMINKDKFTDAYCHSFINIIAKKTEVEAKMIKYPFVLLLVLCVARYNFIDNWRWTAPLAVLTVLSILIVLCTAIMLFREAKIARQKIVDRLNGTVVKLMEDKQNKNESEIKRFERKIEFVKFILEDIQHTKNGAFAPLSGNPILFASLTPIGGMGIISLLENLFR